MKLHPYIAGILSLGLLCAVARGQQPAATPASAPAVAQSPVQKTIDAYLRHLYAFGPDVTLNVGPLKETGVAGLMETNVDLKVGENSESAKMFVSKDGKYLLRGELSDLTKDPLADALAKLDTKDAPSVGDANAAVTLVEFSDFECPVCRQLHDVLRGMLPNYPSVRVIFKDFPIEQLHPWARTAALAARCGFNQDPKAFWKMYDLIYDGQELTSAANAYSKMTDYASQAGLNETEFKSCMAAAEAGAAIDASRQNGQLLEVNSTPTVFVNGRRLVGADPHLLEQYIQYELAQAAQGKPAPKP